MSEPIVFDCTCAKVQTLVDNGLRVTLDLPEQAIEAAAFLMAYKAAGVVLKVTVVPDCKTEAINRGVATGTKRQSERSPANG